MSRVKRNEMCLAPSLPRSVAISTAAAAAAAAAGVNRDSEETFALDVHLHVHTLELRSGLEVSVDGPPVSLTVERGDRGVMRHLLHDAAHLHLAR